MNQICLVKFLCISWLLFFSLVGLSIFLGIKMDNYGHWYTCNCKLSQYDSIIPVDSHKEPYYSFRAEYENSTGLRTDCIMACGPSGKYEVIYPVLEVVLKRGDIERTKKVALESFNVNMKSDSAKCAKKSIADSLPDASQFPQFNISYLGCEETWKSTEHFSLLTVNEKGCVTGCQYLDFPTDHQFRGYVNARKWIYSVSLAFSTTFAGFFFVIIGCGTFVGMEREREGENSAA